ncbi:glucose dehydrogenase [FAD, quinone]-like [Planococcus citri]|uniref:glucose dehydrogenase [FAD, quinone]-like n=1 Tax=Planococcus citri TaxID=170843 RepID=UPI0031F8CFE1
MKSFCALFLIFFIKVCHLQQVSSQNNAVNENCYDCSFKDTSTLPDVNQCSSNLNEKDERLLRIIEYGLKTNCFISDPCRRVHSPIKSPHETKTTDESFDFIIVGAGVSGSILAGRLSENPNHKVLLLEAGPEEPLGPSVPYFSNSALDTSVDWKFETVPQKKACLKTGGICKWPRGKMICGTACMTGLMYTRGSRQIYDSWAQQGNTGWSYDDILEYHKRAENNTQSQDKIDPEYHGFDGPMHVGNFPYLPKVAQLMLEAAQEVGFDVHDLSGKNQTGFSASSVMVDNGVRDSPSRAYLRPVLHRENLKIFIESFATKIIIKNNRAIGIEYLDKFNRTRKVFAKKEVVLSGGVIGSPQLLMLSGIGPKKHLQQLGIPVVKDLPVGLNVHHHVGIETTSTLKGLKESEFNYRALDEYLNELRGPFSSTGLTQVTGFFGTSKAAEDIPDIQFFLDAHADSFKCRRYTSEPNNPTVLGLRVIYLITKCRGTIRLRSKNPFDKPIIDANYLCDEDDENAIIEGIRKMQQIMKSKAFSKYYIEYDASNESSCESYPKDSDDYWRCQIQTNTLGENHHAGSCKMGSPDDSTTVVDPQLRVLGIPNLRVVDASIMPTPINCNTVGPVIMFGEKGAQMIKDQWNDSDDGRPISDEP